VRILFVCTGNICRSPSAEAVARAIGARDGLDWVVDSVGTGAWHVGERPDHRAIQVGAARGYDLSGLTARQLSRADFHAFDHLVALDSGHLSDMRAIAPAGSGAVLSRLMDWLPDTPIDDVPDPYYGDVVDFENMFEMIEGAVAELARKIYPSG
jgi:protein-tyrosine phosphatase